MARWDELNNFFKQTGAKVTFGLNTLIGRKKSNIEKRLWLGDWQSQNAREFMNYTISKGYKIDSYEFGNELCGGGIGARVEAKQYGKDVVAFKNLFGPLSGAWVSEASGAFDSGRKDVSPTFTDGFWHLDQLGMASNFNHKVFCGQTFIGGNYALVDATTFTPNPNYYGALLWHRLTQKLIQIYVYMEKDKTFNVTLSNDDNLHIERHNLKSKDVVRSVFEFKGYQNREEYHLTPLNRDIQSDIVCLNDVPLNPTDSLDILAMDPILIDASSTISVASHSIIFVTIRDFNAPVCA
ncbi:hypothetical protein PTKIN_Ptkin08bG0033100 [Pterospermum kingtungense]